MIKIVIINDIPRNVSRDLRAISRNSSRHVVNDGDIRRILSSFPGGVTEGDRGGPAQGCGTE